MKNVPEKPNNGCTEAPNNGARIPPIAADALNYPMFYSRSDLGE
jgi:hypothetical protein